ncbi:MAG: hypothetical protein DSM106950_45990 [Stigonema ocellatum SAG 48.90 = DSM 106950]|nr:hypothetical protein [Stigonema ocellatum SAG 48.90 = DSM 106950]
MMLCRELAEQEPMRQKFKVVANAEALRKFSTQTDLDFKVYTHRANLRAAEVAFKILQPYQESQPLLEGDSLDDITSPSNKIAPEDEMVTKDHYLKIGTTALTCLGTLTQSTILISTPGAGKTTTMCTAWGRMRERLGDSFQATAIIYKRDDAKAFEGIAQVLCFPDNPERAVLNILGFVRNMKEGGNKGTTNRLFIDDFLSIWEEISARFKGKYIDDDGEITVKRTADNFPVIDWLVSQLNAVFLIGRQSDNALWICSHSPNVESLPFVKDKSSRIAANLIFLARQDPKNKNGNYEVIEANISNHHLIANDEKRSQLSKILPELISLSRESGEPIILTSHGQSGGWEMGLVGSEIQQEYEQYRKQWASVSPPKDEAVIVQPQAANKPDFDELLSEIIKSFSGKEATRISRIEAGCNRVRTTLADFDNDKKKKIWIYLICKELQTRTLQTANKSKLKPH